MTPAAIAALAKMIAEIFVEFVPTIVGLIEKAAAGKDISHEDVVKALPKENQTAALDKIKTAARIAQGLPT